MSQGIAIE
uniref:Uncharacterized protein n=1 Tax=Anguilla anguilla TaxID=7936 RepID=A0A0E9T898_ANGAN